MISKIPVAAENKRVEDNLRARTPEPPLVTAMPAMVVAARVIMLVEFRRRVFQLSRWWPIFLCISILSDIASRIA